jgi:hypothetical protein
MSRRRLVLVAACLVCLVALTVTLPAADPRIENSGSGGWGALTGQADTETEPKEVDAKAKNEKQDEQDKWQNCGKDQLSTSQPQLWVEERSIPGEQIRICVLDGGQSQFNYDLYINGEFNGHVETGLTNITTPYREMVNVSVPELSLQEQVQTQTDAEIKVEGEVAQNEEITVISTADGARIPEMSLSLDGEQVGWTSSRGKAEIQLPERVGTATLNVKRGPIEGERELTLPKPTVKFTSAVLVPGLPTPVRVTADGTAVEGVPVSIPGGGTDTTNADGYAWVRLPIDDQATATAQIGDTESTATVGYLYLRPTLLFVVLPGLLIGLVYTYLRYVSERDHESILKENAVVTGLFVGLADRMVGLASLFQGLSVPRPRWPSGRGVGWRWPSVSTLVPSLAQPRGFSVRSVFSGLFSGSRSRSVISRLNPLASSNSHSDDDLTRERPSLAEEPLGPPEPGTEVRSLWHAFLDRLEIDRRETQTPGQVARKALAAGFPARQVRRLLRLFRRAEYDDDEPGPEQVEDARTTTSDLLDHNPDDGSEEGPT